MATWNMSQYNDILNNARRMAESEYTRQRQDVLDKRAAQDYALRYESDLRKAEKEKDEFEQYKRELPVRNQLADWKLQQETNKMIQEQAKESYKHITPEQRSLLNILANGTATNIKFKGRDYGPASSLSQNQIRRFGLNPLWVQIHQNAQEAKINKERATEIADLKHQDEVGKYKLNARINKEKTAALDDAKLKKDFLSRTFDPETEAYHKILSGVPLTPVEKKMLEDLYPLRLNTSVADIDNADKLPIEDYIRQEYKNNPQEFSKINPAFFKFYAAEQRAAAAQNAEYQRKNALAIAKQKQQEQYNTVSGYMTGFYNDAVSSRSIDPKVAKSKDVVDAATKIFIASNGSLTLEQAFNQAAGIRAKNTPPPPEGVSETENIQLSRLYNKRYAKLDDKEKEKLAAVYSEWKEKHQPSPELKGIDYLKAAQQSAVAFRDLLEKYDLPDDLNTPIDEELYHLEYDYILQDLLAREKALQAEFPQWYKWVKDNPNVAISSNKMMNNLVDDSMREDAVINGVQTKILKPEYQKFFNELRNIQKLRNQLVNRETWLKNLDANRRYGKK